MSIVIESGSDMTVPLGNKTARIFTGELTFPPGGLSNANLAAQRVPIPNSADFLGQGVFAQATAALSSVSVDGGVAAVDRVAVAADPAGLALVVWLVAKDNATIFKVAYQVTAFR